MAQGRVFETVTVDNIPPEDDVEAAFEGWRSSFEASESPGNIKAFRIPLDAQGHASHSAQNQVRLGAWPVDQYDFDTLCDKLMKDFMLPSENMMAVRLIGTLAGKTGVRFNKIVTLQRPNPLNVLPNPGNKDGLADIVRSMNEGNERMMRMIQEMNGGNRPQEGSGEMMRTVAMMRVMMEPMMGMMGPMLAALAGRPLPAPGPTTGMKEMVETMVMLDKFMGNRGGGGNGEADWVKVTSAVAGVAKPLLEIAAANTAASNTRQRRQTRVPATPPPVANPTPTPPPVAVPATPSGVDLSVPSGAAPVATFVDPQTPTPVSPHQGDAMFAEMKAQVDAMVQVAASGSDPVAVANVFFEQTMLTADDKVYGQLATWVENPAYLAQMAIYNPRVHEFKAFFESMRNRLMERIEEEDEASGAES